MPGPPPPSKSYLLKIVDSSDEEDEDEDEEEEEEEEEEDVGHDNILLPTNVSANDDNDDDDDEMEVRDSKKDTSSSSSSSSSSNNKNNEDGDANANDNNDIVTKKKRKKKKKKKKKRAPSKPTTPTAPTAAHVEMDDEEEEEDSTQVHSLTKKKKNTKSVSFDTVTVHSFERVLGTGVVPCDGGWPLGLGNEVRRAPSGGDGDKTVESLDLDTYEAAKQERLKQRAVDNGLPIATTTEPLETRQWDFKHKSRNPLFHLLQEEQRMNILLMASSDDATENSSSHGSGGQVPLKHRDSNGSNSSTGSNKGTSPDKKKRRDTKNKPTASRSQQQGNNNNNSNSQSSRQYHQGSHPTGGQPMNTRNSNTKRERAGSVSNQERYNDTFTQVEVHRIRNELEELRFHRSGEGHVGCTCRKLDVYLLPPNAGKKAHHRRMNVKRVKEELSKRHLLPDAQKTREELELMLHAAVEQEPCCSSQDCPCVRNGIQCQADVCSCWHSSHQNTSGASSTKSESDGSISVETIQARCGNVNGMYAVDFPKIQAYRDRFLKAAHENGGSLEKGMLWW